MDTALSLDDQSEGSQMEGASLVQRRHVLLCNF